MTKGKYNLKQELQNWLADHGRVVIAGIGNPIRMDDFVGVKIVQNLQGRLSKDISLIECETVPESFMDEIVKFRPSHVLLIDAAVMQLKPGEIRLFDTTKITDFPAISTHMLPIRIFCEYITQMSGGKIALLLIQPCNTDFGEDMTPIIQDAAKKVTELLLQLLSTTG
ncbi:MAG: hydrogenase 3 maturation endopeptidase HyCI [Chloroflexota bacterium]|nr:hydrogenase 3 maturation endopeptidase HyCI [Candidatus Sulfotelmatobacter sp.]